jgi:monoamine oxidase
VNGGEETFTEVGPGATSGSFTLEMEEMMERLVVETEKSQKEQTLEQTIDSMNLSPSEKRTMRVMERAFISTDYAADGAQLSSKNWLDDTETKKFNTEVFGQIMPAGYKQIFDSVIAENEIDIRLNTTIASIEFDADNDIVVVTTIDGIAYYARKVIVTVPLGVLQSRMINFSPPLTNERLAAIDSLGMGNLFKVFLEFPRGSNLIPVSASGAYRVNPSIDKLAPYYFLNGIWYV